MSVTGALSRNDATGSAALAASTLCEAFQITAAERPTQVALRTPGDEVTITWSGYATRVRRIAAGLAALGVRRGDTVGLMLVNRPEFHLVDTAALHLGATPFSLYNSSAPQQIAQLFANAGNRIVVTEAQFLPKVRAALAGSAVTEVIVVDGGTDARTLDQLEALGDNDFDFEASWRAVRPTDLATLIYTSGTTGPPKGVELTHANLLAEVAAVQDRAPMSAGGSTVSYLPTAHLADRWIAHYHASIAFGCTVTCVADLSTVVAHLPEARPTVWGGVPRVFEKIRAALEAAGCVDPAAMTDASRAAIVAGLGLDRCQYLVIGGAPVQPELVAYFGALGLPLSEVLGMSETSCLVTMNPPDAGKIGSCGQLLRGMEGMLADDGELLLRGPLIMAGYRGEPERTREVIDAEGWFHTGDLADIDADGYVSIIGRKKELIINSAGKNMSPVAIESAIKAGHPLIGHIVAVGDNRPYNVALIVLDPDASAAFAERNEFADRSTAALAADPAVHEVISKAVAAGNSRLSRVEQIKRFAILAADWQADSDELTATMKLKRKPIADKYADTIARLYDPELVKQTTTEGTA
ncbi:AMP-dependent synthetase/ligase [Nocardia altamirensis]|uniref:AMP-dependent synthetase/ligase n=1 Tax=Nocardia altamirensis TaxID=472158 RepID=UPI0008406D0E|nr:AMP-dependent synthetase/ligase [Nocardia altamirensis]